MSKKTVILISREYGSGGRKIGQEVAKRLNIPFYDKELIQLAAKESGYDEKLFENTQKQSKGTFSYFLSVYAAGMSPQDISLNDQLFLVTAKTIHEVSNESCVIIGRCADYILRDHPHTLSIFVHADLEDRIKRAKDEYGDDAPDLKQKVLRTDKNRAIYYNFYADQKWGHIGHYDLSLNTSNIDLDTCVDIIVNAVEEIE